MKKKAIFLDRDGVINRDALTYTWNIEDFLFLDGVFEACKTFVKNGYMLIVITNQGGIAKGFYQHHHVKLLHEFMVDRFRENGILIDDIFYCPHHNAVEKCLCRKPGSLLVEKALARYQIDPSLSFFIGDRERDVQAGEAAGVKGILVAENSDLRETIPLIGL